MPKQPSCRWVTALAVVVLLAGCPTPPQDLDEFLSATMDQARVPGLAACIVKDGAVVWSGVYGWADAAARTPVTADTHFMLASVSKTITATALMQLYEAGRFRLDDNVNAFLPFVVENPHHAASPLTFRMLLTHTSSIQDNYAVLESLYVLGDSPIALGEFLREYLTPDGRYYDRIHSYYRYAPGEDWNYSNVGMTLAGYLVEVISGVPFDQYCEENIFGPLGMTEAAWFLAGLEGARVARPHQYDWLRREYVPLDHYGYPDYPDGQLRASARAYARLLAVFLGDGTVDNVRILAPETVTEMLSIPFPDVRPDQAHAWFYANADGSPSFGHSGGDQGVTTDVFFVPDEGIGVVVLTNGEIPLLRGG
ncbi:MAG: beta-lactamase family protein, partial [Candidatus Hydrogenedentes bacterium]|nr:beta-lactamase family protein [Candidatus Hydrogenedentota bacterium]